MSLFFIIITDREGAFPECGFEWQDSFGDGDEFENCNLWFCAEINCWSGSEMFENERELSRIVKGNKHAGS